MENVENTQVDTAANNATNAQAPRTDGVTDFLMRMGILGELLTFFWKRKLYWLIPMMVTLLLFAVIIILGNSGVASVFIYSLF